MALNVILRGCAIFIRKGEASLGARTLSTCLTHRQTDHNSTIQQSEQNPTAQQATKDPALDIFDQEYDAQLSNISRIEKINVKIVNLKGEITELQMNKNVSTPYSCSKHISEECSRRSALALVNDEAWNMHAPLTTDCTVNFQTFEQDDPSSVNQAFWRGCSFILGSVIQRAFKPEANVMLHRAVDCPVESGSFVYEFSGDFGDWDPSERELQSLSVMGARLSRQYRHLGTHPDSNLQHTYLIQPLQVRTDVAKLMFSNNSYKLEQLQSLSTDRLTVYKMGTHVDILDGPLVSNANHIGRFDVTAIHDVGECSNGRVYRAQGTALPYTITMHSWTYKMLKENSAKLNTHEEDQANSAKTNRTESPVKHKPADSDEPEQRATAI